MASGPDVFIIQANLIVLAFSLVAMTLLFAFALTQQSLDAIRYKQSPSTASAFWFFFAAYAFLFFLYIWMDIYVKNGRSLDSPEFAIGTDILGNVSNVCFLIAAVAYCRGRDFNVLHAAGAVVLLTMIVMIWAFGWNVLVDQSNLFARTLQYGPEMVLPSVAFVLLGWAFFARWGGIPGAIFLLVSLVYGFLQIPANLVANFGDALRDPSALLATFAYLSAGKILLAFGFLSLLCSSSIPEIAIGDPKYWPDKAVSPPQWFGQVGGWAVSLAASTITALVTQFKCEFLAHFISKCT